MRRFALLSMTLLACSDTATGGDDAPPTLEVTSPERGATSDASQVTVTGRVTDDRAGARVTVNGTDAAVAADGSFSATVSVGAGISVIETHAIDSAGNDIRDVRAVLAGALGTTDGSTPGAIGARVTAAGLGKVSSALAGVAQGLDWKALALGMNPVATGSGCNSLRRIDITDLQVGSIGVALPPGNGSLGMAVDIDNVTVKLHVDFEAVCIGGSTSATVKASRANIDGALAFAVDGGKLAASLPSSSVTLEGFSIDVGGVPGAIESLFRDKARKAAENALAGAIRSKLPAEVDTLLGGLLAKGFSANLLGHDTKLTATPTGVEITPEALTAAVAASVHVTGGEGGVFAKAPATLGGDVWGSGDVGVALAADVMNQLFGGLWAAGAIAPTVSLDGPAAVLGGLLDDDARSIAIEMKLPPTVAVVNDAFELAIGDMMLSVRDASNTEIQRFALSVRTSLAAAPDASGAVHVAVGTPTIKAQVLAQSEVVDVPMTAEKLEGILTGAWGLIGGQVDTALAKLPLPQVAGMSLGSPTLAGRGGFLVLDLPLQ